MNRAPEERIRTISPRPDEKWPRPLKVDDEELTWPRPWTVLRLVYNAFARIFHDPTAMVLASSFFLLIVWGHHGGLDVVGTFTDTWWGPGSPLEQEINGEMVRRPQLIEGLPWDHELIAFAVGFLLLVVLPVCLIKFVFRLQLRDFGLGLPHKDRWGITIWSSLIMVVFAVAASMFSPGNEEMRAEYPIFRDLEYLREPGNFALYQLGYLLFFIAIEFMFRGYLLFGLYRVHDEDAPPGVRGASGPFVFGYYAILISMLSYTAWHLGKPTSEVYGTLIWGLATGVFALVSGTIWHIILLHWLMNVAMDWAILQG